MDQQQRRVIPPAIALPAGSSSTSSSPLLGINDDFYELLQQQQPSVTQAATTRLFSDPIIIPAGAVGVALKMEPELVGGDFMGSSYAWGTTPQYGTQLIYNDANTLTNYGAEQQQAGAPPVVDIAAQFATYAAPVASTATTGAQIQALRDFMVYGNLGATPAAAMSSRATTPVGAPGGFYSDEVAVGMDGVNIPNLPIPSMPSLAYRALCSEIYATTTERSPHRSQFQRENHILAERQRREEMNEKFSALRAMIPKATKKDKASIVGDTIDYVLELEKRLKQLQACKAGSGKVQLGSSSCLQKKKRKTSRCDEDALLLDSPIAATNGASTSSETTTTLLLPVLHVGDCSAASSPSDQITAESKLHSGGGGKAKLDAAAAVAAAEVDVQQLGKQAVVKVVCTRQPGHVLRVLNALEECCKVEVLQSNLMTVADHSIHFVTVQLEEGVSVPTEELVSAVLRAINPAEA